MTMEKDRAHHALAHKAKAEGLTDEEKEEQRSCAATTSTR